MRPKTKLQIRIAQLGTTIPKISKRQKAYAYDNSFDNFAYIRKNDITCFECGHRWPEKNTSSLLVTLGVTCPSCGKELKISQVKNRTIRYSTYFCIITTVEDFQVVRFFWVERNCKAGQKADYFIREVVQNWIKPDGKTTVRALLTAMSFNYNDAWMWDSKLEIRPIVHERYNQDPECIYPRQKYLDIIKRNGFTGDFHNIKPISFLTGILTNQKFETLLKSGQYGMLRYSTNRNIDKYWGAIKICIRNNYLISTADIWCDHVDLLNYFNRDVHNSKYICPDDLHAEHIKLDEKKKRIERDKELEKTKIELKEREEKYKKIKGAFFGLEFSEDEINISVIESVKAFIEEGDELHHCVFSNKYYDRNDSLILSAKKNNERLETIEVSLSKMDTVQSRGLFNKDTPYHDRIVKLVQSNIGKIRQRVSV